MPKSRRPRLSWFRFYADDFLGGTGALTAPECGQYLLLLLHQWGTKDRQEIPADPERLRMICKGSDPGPTVLAKFVTVDNSLRNERLAAEWDAAKREYHLKAEGGGTKIPGQIPPRTPTRIPGNGAGPNQEPRTKSQEPSVPSPTISVGREVVAPSRHEQPPRLPADIAESAVTDEIRKLQAELGSRLARLAEHPNSREMVPSWSRKATSYTRKDGTKVPGVADYRTITSIERLEKSIADADKWLNRLNRGPLEATRGL